MDDELVLTGALKSLSKRAGGKVARLLTTLDTDAGGRIRNTPANIAKVEDILDELRRTLLDDDYIDAVAAFAKGFDRIDRSVAQRFASLGASDPSLRAGLVNLFKRMAIVELLDPTVYVGPIRQQLADTIVGGILGQSTVRELAQATDAVTEGLGGNEVAAIEATTTQALDRTLTVKVAEEVGAEFFRYQGRPIKTTRSFCREREGHVWHREEINEWGRLAAEDPEANGWPGMVEGTNEKTIWIYLGGYYGDSKVCRHALTPLHRRDVPKEDLERMRAKGLID